MYKKIISKHLSGYKIKTNISQAIYKKNTNMPNN